MKVGSRRIGVALVAASLLFTGCSDGTGPGEPFDPSHAEDDLETLGDLFDNAQLQQLNEISQYIDPVGGGLPVMAISSARALMESRNTNPASARRMASVATKALSLSRTGGARPSYQALPADVLGTTFVFDTATNSYVESDRSGAPATGVRFVVYALEADYPQVDQEVGYVDFIDLSPNSQTSVGLRLRFVGGATTYLDYAFTVAPTGTNSGTLGVDGFLSNGTTKLNFDVDMNMLIDDEAQEVESMNVAFEFSIPSRGFSTNGTWELVDAETSQLLEIDLTVRSGGTNLRYDIVEDASTETINATVYVNNRIFATITGDSGDPVVAGAGGEELTLQEQIALVELVEIGYAPFFFLLYVIQPAASILGTSFLPLP